MDLTLCRCQIITGGALALAPDCPVHRRVTAVNEFRLADIPIRLDATLCDRDELWLELVTTEGVRVERIFPR